MSQLQRSMMAPCPARSAALAAATHRGRLPLRRGPATVSWPAQRRISEGSCTQWNFTWERLLTAMPCDPSSALTQVLQSRQHLKELCHRRRPGSCVCSFTWLTRSHCPGNAACRLAEKVLLPAPGTPTRINTTGLSAAKLSCAAAFGIGPMPSGCNPGRFVRSAWLLHSQKVIKEMETVPANSEVLLAV